MPCGQETYRVTADASGGWQQVVPLKKGRNDFTITATDPDTGKDSEAVKLIVTVPVAAGGEAPDAERDQPQPGDDVHQRRHPGPGHDDR